MSTTPGTAYKGHCPLCEYDLRAAMFDADGRLPCPECGKRWHVNELVRQYGTRYQEEQRSDPLWSLGLLLPPIIAPWVALALVMIGTDEGVALAATMAAIAVYAAMQSALTTRPQPLWIAHVVIRATALFMMITILSIFSAFLTCLPMSIILSGLP